MLNDLIGDPPMQYWFVFQKDCLAFIKNNNDYKLPMSLQAFSAQGTLKRKYFFGLFNQTSCYCVEMDDAHSLPDDIVFIPLRKAFEILGDDWYGAAAKACSIINWDKNHQYCGRCGKATQIKNENFERVCLSCGLSFFPRMSPSMIVLIKNNDRILMARSPHFTPGAYGLIAGFLEAGENIEEAIHREVKEETGLSIKNLSYFGSQSWPFPDSLMIGFTADYAEGELVIDYKEIETAGWYRFDDLPGRPSTSISIAGKLIDHFVAEQQSYHGLK